MAWVCVFVSCGSNATKNSAHGDYVRTRTRSGQSDACTCVYNTNSTKSVLIQQAGHIMTISELLMLLTNEEVGRTGLHLELECRSRKCCSPFCEIKNASLFFPIILYVLIVPYCSPPSAKLIYFPSVSVIYILRIDLVLFSSVDAVEIVYLHHVGQSVSRSRGPNGATVSMPGIYTTRIDLFLFSFGDTVCFPMGSLYFRSVRIHR